jgi:hypothetical protein
MCKYVGHLQIVARLGITPIPTQGVAGGAEHPAMATLPPVGSAESGRMPGCSNTEGWWGGGGLGSGSETTGMGISG